MKNLCYWHLFVIEWKSEIWPLLVTRCYHMLPGGYQVLPGLYLVLPGGDQALPGVTRYSVKWHEKCLGVAGMAKKSVLA